jgi:hypothetical protein
MPKEFIFYEYKSGKFVFINIYTGMILFMI